MAGCEQSEVRTPHGVWKIYSGGKGNETILFLPGSLRKAEVWFPVADALSGQFRFVAPSPPPIETMEEMVSGCLCVMDAHGVDKFHAVGHSFGGMAAQALAHHMPNRVLSLSLFNTAAPTPLNSSGIHWAFTSGLTFLARLSMQVPDKWARWGYPRRLERTHLRTVSDGEKSFWTQFLTEGNERLSMEEIGAITLRAVPRFFRDTSFRLGDFRNWHNRVLLVNAEDDATIPRGAQRGLHALHPHAKVKSFATGGHLLPITRWAQSGELLSRFLPALV